MQLVAYRCDLLCGRTYEGDAMLLAQRRQGSALGQESITRMNGIRASSQRSLHDGLGAQVGMDGWRGPDADGAIGAPRRQRIAVGVGNGQHRFQAELAAA